LILNNNNDNNTEGDSGLPIKKSKFIMPTAAYHHLKENPKNVWPNNTNYEGLKFRLNLRIKGSTKRQMGKIKTLNSKNKNKH